MQEGLAKLEEALRVAQVVVFTAPTGCGKSTRIPRMLSELESNKELKVACTQPRRIAATMLAKNVARSMGTSAQDGSVSYKIRFEDTTNPSTKLVFMTDGALLNELMNDNGLSAYSTIIVDEAHERSLGTELLLCLLKGVLKRNEGLKLVIMSATLNAQLFVQHYVNSMLIEVTDIAMFDITFKYECVAPNDIVKAAVEKAAQIHVHEPEGHVLIFLPGVDEIDRCYSSMESALEHFGREYGFGPYQVYKLHAKQTREEQQAGMADLGFGDFTDANGYTVRKKVRKIIVATNIAEASLTIDGVGYVVDGGKSKKMWYNWKTRRETLITGDIDQAAAKQRAGRTGRTCPGTVYRLYTEAHFYDEMCATNSPDIVRCDPTELTLKLLKFGVSAVLDFPFIESPPRMAMLRAFDTLGKLGALTSPGDSALLSDLGEKMASMPTSPELVVSLNRAHELGCVGLMMALVAMIEEGTDCFFKPKSAVEKSTCYRIHQKFSDNESEHWRLVLVFLAFKKEADANTDQSNGRRWCDRNRVVFTKMKAALRIFYQLASSCVRYNWGVNNEQLLRPTYVQKRNVLKSLLRGHVMNVVVHKSLCAKDAYTSMYDNLPVVLHYSTQENVAAGKDWMLYSNIFEHNHLFKISCCSSIDPAWLLSEARTFFISTNFKATHVRERLLSLQPAVPRSGSLSPTAM